MGRVGGGAGPPHILSPFTGIEDVAETIDITAVCDDIIREALELRFGAKLPVHPAAPSAVLEALFDVRHRLDRVDELLAKAIRIAGTVQDGQAIASAQHDDAWDREITRLRNSPVRQGDEYSTARERHAVANLAVLDLRHKVRTADDVVRKCERAVSLVRLVNRGLEGVRQDLRTWLDGLKYESHLDRQ
jgi:hypothetical protein